MINLLRDTAYTSTLYQGSGAGMVIKDALVLTRLLAKIIDKIYLEAVFRVYDVVRQERTQRLVTTSRDAGYLYEF